MKRPVIPCNSCDGKGTAPLPDHLFTALKVLSRLGRASAPEVHEASPDKAYLVGSATNRRLEELRRLDLVERSREGIVWKYFVKEKH